MCITYCMVVIKPLCALTACLVLALRLHEGHSTVALSRLRSPMPFQITRPLEGSRVFWLTYYWVLATGRLTRLPPLHIIHHLSTWTTGNCSLIPSHYQSTVDSWQLSRHNGKTEPDARSALVQSERMVARGSRIIHGGAYARIAGLGLFWFEVFHPLPGSVWADGKLAELAEQVGKDGGIS